jgi:hypothetical protein
MSRNIPRHLRHKYHPEAGRVISHDISVMVLRTGAVLIWCGCLVLIGIVASDLFRNSQLEPGQRILQPAGLSAVCAGALVASWRLWALRRWAAIVTVAASWVFSLGEPWRPVHYPTGIVDVSAALGASVMIGAIVAFPLTVPCVVERSRLKPGF